MQENKLVKNKTTATFLDDRLSNQRRGSLILPAFRKRITKQLKQSDLSYNNLHYGNTSLLYYHKQLLVQILLLSGKQENRQERALKESRQKY